jgi:uncharacterized protein involved in response to NO
VIATTQKKIAKHHAHAWFFPAAALYAAFILPVSLQVMMTQLSWLPGLATGFGHAHEMLFGFALAVIAGYLLGPLPTLQLGAMLGLWIVARLAYLLMPGSLLAAGLNGLFAVLLAIQIAPKFMRSAKKWRNQAIGPLLLAICAVAAVSQLGRYIGSFALQQTLLFEAVLLISLLMLFMGGRIIAPAVAGHFHKIGQELDARVQPRIEGALIIAMASAIVLYPLPFGQFPASAALAAAGLLAAIRLARWRLWHCLKRPDLLCLAAGYGWLSIGLLVLSIAVFTQSYRIIALHVITIGALGSLSIGVMARLRLQRAKADPATAPLIMASTVLIAIATIARSAGGLGFFQTETMLWLAALAWSLAFLLLVKLQLSVPAR